MRARPAFAGSLVAVTSCLIAPPPPPPDANPAICLQSGDLAGPAIAVTPNGAHDDTVFRGGVTAAGSAVVWSYTGPIANTRCPAQATLLSPDTFSQRVVDAITFAPALADGAAHVFVLVSDGSAHASVHDLRVTNGVLGDVGTFSGDLGLPTSVIVAGEKNDHPAFVNYLTTPPQVWFGGGTAFAIASYAPGGGSGLAVSFTSANAWYGAAQIDGGSAVALVGSVDTIDATAVPADEGSAFTLSAATSTSSRACDPPCASRVARPVYHNDAITAPIAIMTIANDASALELTDSDGVFSYGANAPAPDTSFSLVDADFANISGSTVNDLAVLWESTIPTANCKLMLYLDPQDRGSAAPEPSTGSATCDGLGGFDRVLVDITSDNDRRMLLLTDHPADNPEACFTYDGTSTLALCL